jgi:hypothetical protein
MVWLDQFPNVYCPTCRRVQPYRFEVLKADAYIDHDSADSQAHYERVTEGKRVDPYGRRCNREATLLSSVCSGDLGRKATH